MKTEIEETKQGVIILTCECGLIHRLKLNDEGDIIVSTKYVKPEISKNENKETKNENENGKEKKRESIFFRE